MGMRNQVDNSISISEPVAFAYEVRAAGAESAAGAAEGLVVHGYGGNKAEVLGLAVGIIGAAAPLSLRLLAVDLPGHGQGGDYFSLRQCLDRLSQALKQLRRPVFFVGHSVGARLGLEIGLGTGALISAPGDGLFEGGRKDLVRTLRARRVREERPYSGLEEIVSREPRPVPTMMMVRARYELQAVTGLMEKWRHVSFQAPVVEKANHLDIVTMVNTAEVVGAWLKKTLM